MSFREKSTWITFVLLLVVFGYYFVSVAWQLIHPVHPHTNFFMLFFVLLLVIVVMAAVLHVIATMRSPADAKTPADERERLIALKAKRPAFFVLLIAAFLSVGVAHLGVGVWPMLNAMLFAIWLGELTNYGAQLYFYRRET
ncbi:MAG: hypothetical protein WA825_12795 [Steroidobacteraceae bacterium]